MQKEIKIRINVTEFNPESMIRRAESFNGLGSNCMDLYHSRKKTYDIQSMENKKHICH